MGNGQCIKLLLQLITAFGDCSKKELERIEAGPQGTDVATTADS